MLGPLPGGLSAAYESETAPMTTIQIDEQTAESLKSKAQALGMNLQEYLRAIAGNGSQPAEELTHVQWSAKLRAWAASFPALPHVADDSRESIYAGRGE